MGQRLGQHFLVNKNKIQKIVEALELKNNDVVVEIGPGHGELTSQLKIEKSKIKIIAIEKDETLAKKFSENFQFSILNFQSSLNFQLLNNKTIIIGDALKILPELSRKLNFASYKLCGNIPYYITGRLLRILSELENKPLLTVLTIQKEVAQRMCGIKEGSSNPYGMNLLAAITQYWAGLKIVGYISKNDFRPTPKVDSAIIKLSPRDNADYMQKNADKFYKFVKVLFKQPRKTILNNLAASDKIQKERRKEEIVKKLQALDINPQDRPENLSLARIEQLSTLF